MLSLRRGTSCLLTLFVSLLAATPVLAQAPRDARVQITVVDQTNSVVPGATVRLTGLETATQAQTMAPGTTGDNGIAILEKVAPGGTASPRNSPGSILACCATSASAPVRAGTSSCCRWQSWKTR